MKTIKPANLLYHINICSYLHSILFHWNFLQNSLQQQTYKNCNTCLCKDTPLQVAILKTLCKKTLENISSEQCTFFNINPSQFNPKCKKNLEFELYKLNILEFLETYQLFALLFNTSIKKKFKIYFMLQELLTLLLKNDQTFLHNSLPYYFSMCFVITFM